MIGNEKSYKREYTSLKTKAYDIKIYNNKIKTRIMYSKFKLKSFIKKALKSQ